jgi:hypothetical protein
MQYPYFSLGGAISIPPEFFRLFEQSGAFGCGALFGGLICSFFGWLQSGNDRLRIQSDQAREKELRTQLENKDERISKLHRELERTIKEMKEIK